MCKNCGCGGETPAAHDHKHPHDHDGDVPHDHDHHHGPEHTPDHDHVHGRPRRVELEQNVLARNDAMAAQNRTWLAERAVTAINLISSPGAGKTLLLERTLERLRGDIACAVIAGDQQTDHDARRLSGKGATVHQIETLNACHLDAGRVSEALPRVIRDGTRLLFIENVGNLVCPAAFDLGETFKVALLSTAEGEDKPVKYPTLFANAQVVVITKMDLASHLDWDLALCRRYVQQVHPGVYVFELSARTGEGMDAWIDYLRRLVA